MANFFFCFRMNFKTTGICAVCGVRRSRNEEKAIAFPTNSHYRERFAEKFDYSLSFIRSLGRDVRICKEHFEPGDYEDGKTPKRLPTRAVGRVGFWPRANETSKTSADVSARCSLPASSASPSLSISPSFVSATLVAGSQTFLPPQMPTTSASSSSAPSSVHHLPNTEEIIDVERVDEDSDENGAASAEEEEEDDELAIDNHTAALVEISQLLLLFRFCNFCGEQINERTIVIKKRVGNISVRYRCRKCNQYCQWRAQTTAPSGWPTTTIRVVASAITSAFSLIVSTI